MGGRHSQGDMGNSIESRPSHGSVPHALQTRLTLSTHTFARLRLIVGPCMLERLQESPQTELD
jgi:hypothetical protein